MKLKLSKSFLPWGPIELKGFSRPMNVSELKKLR